MKIKWFGQSAFLITSQEGLKIVTDPYYTPTETMNYDSIDEVADIVTVSHDHRDHNNIASVKDKPEVLRSAGTHQTKGIQFRGLVSSHDNACGSQRGVNIIFCFAVDGVMLCHLGDIGHQPSERLLSQIGEVDVLLVPTGGIYTIDPVGANEVCGRIKPSVVIPMHYMTAKRTGPPLAHVDEFVMLRTNVQMLDTSEVEFEKHALPTPTQTIVLKHAL